MNAERGTEIYTLQRFEPAPQTVYPIEVAAQLSELSRHEILRCWKRGFVLPRLQAPYGALYFDASAIRTLPYIAQLQDEQGVNSRASGSSST